MKNNAMKNVVLISLAAVFATVLFSCGNGTDPAQEFTMQGTVRIAPLCPVEPCTLSDAETDRIYGNYTIFVRQEKGGVILQTIQNLNRSGKFTLKLKPGRYVLDYTSAPTMSRTLTAISPDTFEIGAGKPIDIGFQIDTGIR